MLFPASRFLLHCTSWSATESRTCFKGRIQIQQQVRTGSSSFSRLRFKQLIYQLLLTAGPTYCTRVGAEAYSEKTTKEELWSLLRTIHENPKFSSKEKRRLLGQFYKGHPEIFVQYFGERLSSVNAAFH